MLRSARSLRHGIGRQRQNNCSSSSQEITAGKSTLFIMEEAQKRARNRERAAQRRAMETESERSHRLESSRRYSAERRARESEEKRAERRMMDRKRAAERRARESQSEREHRLALGRQRAAERRAAESEEEREHRLAQNRKRLAIRRASKSEKLNLQAAATQGQEMIQKFFQDQTGHFTSRGSAPKGSSGPCLSMVDNGELDGHGREQLRMHQPAHTSYSKQLDTEQAGLTTSEPLLPVCAASVVSLPIAVEILIMATGTANVVQLQQEQQQVGATAEHTATPSTSGASGGGEKTGEPMKQEVLEIKEFRAVEPNLERHYNDLLKAISEIGRDVKPAYTNNKVSTDRLRKNIMMARGIVRECVQDVDRLAAMAAVSSSNSTAPGPSSSSST